MFSVRSLIPKSKKLLVLDLDHTLADFTSRDELIPFHTRIRPHLKYFLTVSSEFYNIVIWSATNRTILYSKLDDLEMLKQQPYTIWFCLDSSHMQWAKASTGAISVKPLSVIWESYPSYSSKNTLMIDDNVTNFYLNPHNGLTIEPYYIENFNTDHELLDLSSYVYNLAKYCNNFSKVDHSAWKEHNP